MSLKQRYNIFSKRGSASTRREVKMIKDVIREVARDLDEYGFNKAQIVKVIKRGVNDAIRLIKK